MPNIILVMIGGALGAAMRYEAGRVALARLGPDFPWGILFVNLAGGLFIGLLAGSLGGRAGEGDPLWLLLGVGVLGGFTTFSAFSLDLFAMLEGGRVASALAYAAASVLGSLLLLAAGFRLARSMAS